MVRFSVVGIITNPCKILLLHLKLLNSGGRRNGSETARLNTHTHTHSHFNVN